MPNYPKATSRKIKYDSPSGFVHIGKYVPPFEKNDTGFGFKGVVVEDFESGKLQCSVCGEWFEQLVQHVQTHDLNCKEYKIKFGLLQSTALKSKKMRLKQSEVMQKLRKSHRKHRMVFKKNNSFAGNRLGIKKAVESQNKYGVCDLQIMQKIIELYKELGRTPTLTQLQERYGRGFIFQLNKRYNSYVKYCNQIGLNPNYSNFNPKYSREYFIEKCKDKKISVRIFTINESRALYKYFKGGIVELKEVVREAGL
jgi:hypothetical protein